MKKSVAIVLALGAVIGIAACLTVKRIQEELETGLPTSLEDFETPSSDDDYESECF